MRNATRFKAFCRSGLWLPAGLAWTAHETSIPSHQRKHLEELNRDYTTRGLAEELGWPRGRLQVIERANKQRNFQPNPPTFSHFVSLSHCILATVFQSALG